MKKEKGETEMNEDEKNLAPANDETIEIKEETASPEVIADPEGVTAKKKFGKKPLLISIAAVVVIAIAAIIAVSAMSSAVPIRPSGISSTKALRSSTLILEFILVSIRPGAIQLTVIPLGASSFARAFVMPISPDFDAE